MVTKTKNLDTFNTNQNTKCGHNPCCINDYINIPSCKKTFAMYNSILHKHGAPLIIPQLTKKFQTGKFTETDLYITWDVSRLNMRELSIPSFYRGLMNNFICNRNQRFFAFPVVLFHPSSIVYPYATAHLTNSFSHMIIVLYDKCLSCLEIFDPSCNDNLYIYDWWIFNTVLVNTFNNTFKLGISNLCSAHAICNPVGIQLIQEAEIATYDNSNYTLGDNIGFCSFFCLWYLNLRLSNPDQSPSQLLYPWTTIKPSEDMKVTTMIKNFAHRLRKDFSYIDRMSFVQVINHLSNTYKSKS